MSINKSISYLLCNKGIIVNLYKLHFLFSYFSFQPNKRIFHLPTFLSLQPNTHKGKLNIFYSPTFLFSHFSTPPTKHTLTICLETGRRGEKTKKLETGRRREKTKKKFLACKSEEMERK